jgi:hypothetical protein
VPPAAPHAPLSLPPLTPQTPEVAEIDQNLDGRADLLHLTATLASPVPIHSVKLLLQLTYTVQARRWAGLKHALGWAGLGWAGLGWAGLG